MHFSCFEQNAKDATALSSLIRHTKNRKCENTVGFATKNECYNEQFLSKKSGCYNKHRRYNERGGILFILESSIIIFTKERFFILFMYIRLFMTFIMEIFFIVFTNERLFMLLKFTCTVYKGEIN
jgi:hypothetical protein